MTDIQFASSFKRRLKGLAKRYRHIQEDIQPVIDELQKGNFIGDKIPGLSIRAFKVRAKNSDIPVGKSGGYRLIYQVSSFNNVVLLLIYAKSEQTDVSIKELEETARRFLGS